MSTSGENKTPLDQFDLRTIEIYIKGQVERHPAWCFGEWGIIKNPQGRWELWNIPRGMCLAGDLVGVYSSADHAAPMVLDMVKMKNNWAGIDRLTDEDMIALFELSCKHKALPAYHDLPDLETLQSLKKTSFLNGAKREDYT